MEENVQDVLPIYKELIFVENIALEPATPVKGQFSKSILILFQANDDQTESQTLLENILKACKINVDDTFFFKISNLNEVIPTLNTYPAEYIISFGVLIQNENMRHTASLYQPNSFKTASILYSDPLSTIIKTPDLKAKLWAGLQKLFKLNP